MLILEVFYYLVLSLPTAAEKLFPTKLLGIIVFSYYSYMTSMKLCRSIFLVFL